MESDDFSALPQRERAVIEALFAYVQRNPDEIGLPEDTTDVPAAIGVPRGIFLPILDSLVEREILSRRQDHRNGGMFICLTPTALNVAEASIRRGSSGPLLPASDRVVRLNDNSQERNAALDALENVERELNSGSNNLPLDSDQRAVVAREVGALRKSIEDGRVRLGELAQAVTKGSPLTWLADKFGSHAVGEIATVAILAISTLIKLFVG